jgi:16S rRNA processing protein RimM
VGRVRGLHGLHGLVRVEELTDRPEERFAPGRVLHPEGSAEALTIEGAAPVDDGPGWRLQFREIRDRAAAERLRDAYLEIEVDRSTDLAPGAFYWHEVIGTEVRDTTGSVLGKVADVYRVATTEIIVVRDGPAGEFDVPVVKEIVRVFAPERGEIVVDESVLDLGAAPVDAPVPKPRRKPRWSRHGRGAAAGAAPGTAPEQPAEPDPAPGRDAPAADGS